MYIKKGEPQRPSYCSSLNCTDGPTILQWPNARKQSLGKCIHVEGLQSFYNVAGHSNIQGVPWVVDAEGGGMGIYIQVHPTGVCI